MVLMNGSKKARNARSITNNTKIFGGMSGLAPLSGKTGALRNHILSKATVKNRIPQGAEGFTFMKDNNLLSKNPQCSGGVGKGRLFMCYR